MSGSISPTPGTGAGWGGVCTEKPAAYRTWVLKVLTADFGAEQVDPPGVTKEVRGGLHNALPAGKVVFCVPVKVPTQSGHTALVHGIQLDVHPCAWRKQEHYLCVCVNRYLVTPSESKRWWAMDGGPSVCPSSSSHRGVPPLCSSVVPPCLFCLAFQAFYGHLRIGWNIRGRAGCHPPTP